MTDKLPQGRKGDKMEGFTMGQNAWGRGKVKGDKKDAKASSERVGRGVVGDP